MFPVVITDPAMSALDVVIAHKGWDELLMFGAPVVLAVFAVRWAERRSKSEPDGEPDDPDAVDPDSADTGATGDADPGGPPGHMP
jgi:hypothetical protein